MASCSIITQSTVFFAESSSSQLAYLNPTDNFLSEKQSAEGWIYQSCAVSQWRFQDIQRLFLNQIHIQCLFLGVPHHYMIQILVIAFPKHYFLRISNPLCLERSSDVCSAVWMDDGPQCISNLKSRKGEEDLQQSWPSSQNYDLGPNPQCYMMVNLRHLKEGNTIRNFNDYKQF